MENKKKIIIFSHESDIDGLGSIIIGKIAFGDIDYVLASNINILEEKFRDYLERGELFNYDKIYVTDLALLNPSLDMVSEDPILSLKVFVFDHHKSSIDVGCGNYNFTTIMETDENGKKRCGTDLFYEYLYSSDLILKTAALDEFVELTRLEDTWEWKTTGNQGLKAHDLAILFNGIGIESYIETMLRKLNMSKNSFELDQGEKNVIMEKKDEYLAALQRIWSEAEFFVDEYKNKFAGVFADYEYRNELAEYVRKMDDIELKYLVLIALEKGPFGQKSYRSIAVKFDVSEIAEIHGGGGHVEAASVNITEKQKEKALILRKKSNRDSIIYLTECCFK